MSNGKWIIFLIVMLLATPVSADMYKYIDENGNTVFTDDYGKVPKEQREDIEGIPTYEAKPTEKSDKAPSDKKEGQNDGDDELSDDNESKKAKDKLDDKTSVFDINKALQEEIKALQKEKKRLDNKKGGATRKEIKNYNAMVNSYEERRKAYEVKVDAHNKKVAKELKERKERKEQKED